MLQLYTAPDQRRYRRQSQGWRRTLAQISRPFRVLLQNEHAIGRASRQAFISLVGMTDKSNSVIFFFLGSKEWTKVISSNLADTVSTVAVGIMA